MPRLLGEQALERVLKVPFTLQFHLTVDMTVESLTEARDKLDWLIAVLARDAAQEAGHPRADAAAEDPQVAADLVARRLREGLGGETWGLLHAAASNFEPEQEFTLSDLADLLQVSLPTARAWHRAASKVMRRTDGPDVLHKRWDSRAHQNRYKLMPEMRRALLEAGR